MTDQPGVSAEVSVLMPLYNAQATLAQSVASVQAQSFRDWELVMIDDGSTDATLELAHRLAANDLRLRVMALGTNQGAAKARNLGLEKARGRFIAFLDADDQWMPDKLSRQLGFMQASGAALSFTGYRRVMADGRLIASVRVPGTVDYATLLKRNLLGCLTVMYDTRLMGKQPMPDLRRQQDYALWLALVRQFGPARGLDEELAIYRVGQGSLSSNKALAARDIWRVYREHERLPLHRAVFAFAHYVYFGLRYRWREQAEPLSHPEGSAPD